MANEEIARDVGLGVAENLTAVLDNELDGVISRLHIDHFALEAMVAHDGRRKDNSKVFRGHLLDVSQAKPLDD